MTWNAIVIIICLLLAGFMIWKEYRRENRLRLPLRIVSVVLASAALACIALPISYSSKSITGIKDGILLTRGYAKDSLTAYQSSKLFTTDAAIQKAYPKLKITLVADLGDFPAGNYNIASLHILGYGLNGDELAQLKHFPVKFHPATIPAGITSISWNHHIKIGEALQVQAKFTGNKSKTSVILKGLNTTLDSVILPANGGSFSLQTIPKNTGKANYILLALSGKDTIENEVIPFEVQPAKPLKVLMLSTSPDFENRFLKNWLAQHGYGVAVRTAISKEKFSREYFNMPQTLIDHITTPLLDKFDIVIGDLSAFKLLSPAENTTLQQQMLQKGLGVIAKADSAAKGTSFLANAFAMDRISDKNQRSLQLTIEGQSKPSSRLTLDAVFIKPQANTQPLVYDEQGHISSSSTIYGSGKIVFTTLSNTYSWVLAGNETDYTALWAMLIDKASRKTPATQQWAASPQFPPVGEAATLILNGPASLPLQIKSGTSNLAFAQNPTLPFSWTATYWPTQNGWQQITQNGSPVYQWYAFEPNAWASLHAAENVEATEKYLAANNAKADAVTTAENTIRVPVSKIYFYILLLLACTYLWVEKKL
jgi:hypothetical protein